MMSASHFRSWEPFPRLAAVPSLAENPLAVLAAEARSEACLVVCLVACLEQHLVQAVLVLQWRRRRLGYCQILPVAYFCAMTRWHREWPTWTFSWNSVGFEPERSQRFPSPPTWMRWTDAWKAPEAQCWVIHCNTTPMNELMHVCGTELALENCHQFLLWSNKSRMRVLKLCADTSSISFYAGSTGCSGCWHADELKLQVVIVNCESWLPLVVPKAYDMTKDVLHFCWC